MSPEATTQFLCYFFKTHNTDDSLPLHENKYFIHFILNKIKDMEEMEILEYLYDNFMEDGEFSDYKFAGYTVDIMNMTITRNKG